MYILAHFTDAGAPATGLSPTIRIRQLSNGSLIVTDASMTEVGDGQYEYEFTSYDYDIAYGVRCYGGSGLPAAEQYFFDNLKTAEELVNGVWDRELKGSTHNIPTSAGRRLRALQDFGLYEGGAVWVDTINGVAGTVDFENGVVNNPVDSIADARTIADSIGLASIHFLSGSSDILAEEYDNFVFTGSGYTIDLNGQAVNGASFERAIIVGNDDGSNTIPTRYRRCGIGDNILGLAYLSFCILQGDLVLAEAGTYLMDACASGVAGTDTPSIDFQDTNENKNLNLRHYSGGIEVKNFGHGIADHNMSLEGDGQIVLNANCSNANAGDSLAIRGNFTITDNVDPWGGTISDDARFAASDVADVVWDELLKGSTHNIPTSAGRYLRYIGGKVINSGNARGSGTGSNQIQLAEDASSDDGAYDPATVAIISGTGEGQSRLIYQYDGSTRIATVDRNWKVLPSTDSEYIIEANPGREHVNEGLAQDGTADTITLNALASDNDNAYSGQLVFIRSGGGEDQVGLVKSYNGTTKVATMWNNWAVIPDSTAGYAMLPMDMRPETIARGVWDRLVASHLTPGTAGLALMHTVYNEIIHIDTIAGSAGTEYPIGTNETPVNNFADAVTLANLHGISEFHIMSNLTLGATDDADGFKFVAPTGIDKIISVIAGCSTNNTTFERVVLTGVLDGNVWIERCTLSAVTGIKGFVLEGMFVSNCSFDNSITSVLYNCGSNSVVTPIELDLDGSPMLVIGWKGMVKLINKTGSETVTFDLLSGEVEIAASCIAGAIRLTGIGTLVDNSDAGCTVTQTELITGSDITLLADVEGGRWKIVSNQMIFYKADNVTEVMRFNLLDAVGAATMANPFERTRV